MTLTLEQVLARSLRLPSRRVNKALFNPTKNAVRTPTSTTDAKGMEELMKRIEIADERALEARGMRLSHGTGPLARNSQDLLTHLNIAKRMGSWSDALSTFVSNTRTGTATPNLAHLTVVVDTCLQCNMMEAALTLLRDPQTGPLDIRQQAFARVAASICKSQGWAKAVECMEKSGADLVTVEAYNHIISDCSKRGDWETSMKLVAQMEAESSTSSMTNGSSLGTSASSTLDSSTRPKPDAVTFAALVSCLQESGKQDLALQVMMKLPPETREIILTSTVALIHVWSEQRSKKGPPNA